jgi:hypothetical protein
VTNRPSFDTFLVKFLAEFKITKNLGAGNYCGNMWNINAHYSSSMICWKRRIGGMEVELHSLSSVWDGDE